MDSLHALQHSQIFMMNNKEIILKACSGDRICVALSGGADSVCLLHQLWQLTKSNNFKLSAVHINHHLRGEESNRDADFCQKLCADLKIPLEVYEVDVINQMEKGESVELAARRLRYEIFEKCNADYIATAHNADDSLETFIINFSRGSGLRGLCGIPSSRGRYIRPLLNFTKQEILDYCNQNYLDYVTDSSNLSDDYTRNKIRHHILPELEKINPKIRLVAIRNFELLNDDNDFLEQSAKELKKLIFDEKKGLKAEGIRTAHSAISARVIIDYCFSITNRFPDALHINQMKNLCFGKGGEIELFDGYRATLKKGWCSIINPKKIKFAVETEVVSVETYRNSLKINNLLLKNAIDYDKIMGKLVLRTRMPQDTIKLAGRGVTKPLRRLQAEVDIYKDYRSITPVAADDSGVIWSYQVGFSENVKISDNTQKVLIFKVYQE